MGRYDKDWSWKPSKDVKLRGKSHKSQKAKPRVAQRAEKRGFYHSWEWTKLRYETLKYYGAQCMLCNSTWDIVVDHIKPRSRFPDLELDPDNVQVLCQSCNRGKSNNDYTDFRPKLPQSELDGDALAHMKTLQ